MPFARTARRRLRLLLIGLALACAPGRAALADDLAELHAAVEQAAAQHRAAMTTLETRSREETAAAVHHLREAWQTIADRLATNRPAAFADDEQLAGLFMQVDMGLVGALIVIDIGSREAAREALAPIQETLSQLRKRTTPGPQ